MWGGQSSPPHEEKYVVLGETACPTLGCASSRGRWAGCQGLGLTTARFNSHKALNAIPAKR
jgi:hypothetical protein